MTSPYAAVDTLMQAAANLSYETRLFAESNTKHWTGLESVVRQNVDNDFGVEVLAGVAAARAGLSSALGQRRSYFDPIMRAYAKVGDVATTDLTVMVRRLRELFEAGSYSYKTRGISFGSVSAGGGNAGNGTINRLTTDRFNKAIQSVFIDSKTAVCTVDASMGARKGQEVIEVRGGRASRDLVDVSGSGQVINLQCQDAGTSRLSNPSFSRYDGDATAPTAIGDWTPLSNITNFVIDETNYYRAFDGDLTSSGAASAALKIVGNDTISQQLSVRGNPLSQYVPMYLQIAWNRSIGSGDGTLTLTLGGVTASVALSAQSGWQILRIAIGQNNWLRQFSAQDLSVKIQLASRTTGYVLVDDVILVPYTPFLNAGDWLCAVGGSTPFLVGDSFSWADTCSADSKIIGEWCRAYPDIECPFPPASSPTVADPS